MHNIYFLFQSVSNIVQRIHFSFFYIFFLLYLYKNHFLLFILLLLFHIIYFKPNNKRVIISFLNNFSEFKSTQQSPTLVREVVTLSCYFLKYFWSIYPLGITQTFFEQQRSGSYFVFFLFMV